MSDVKKPAIPETNTSQTFKVNLAGVQPAGAGLNLAAGIYKCRTTGYELVTGDEGNKKIKLKCTTLAPVAGQGILKTVTTKATGLAFLVSALRSHGVPAAALNKGEIEIGPKAFLEKECYIQYNPEKDANGYDTREFVMKEDWEAWIASQPNGNVGTETPAADASALS